MASDDLLSLYVLAQHLAHTVGYIAVAGAVETIAAHVILLVKLVRHGIQISVVGHCRMERVVEHAHLRNIWHEMVNGADAFQVACVVNRSQVAEFLYTVFHALVDNHALAELVAALHDAVSHSVNLVEALDSANLFIEQN